MQLVVLWLRQAEFGLVAIFPYFHISGSFSKGIAEGEVDPSFGPLEAVRLTIQTDSPVWIILSEVNYDQDSSWQQVTHTHPFDQSVSGWAPSTQP